MQTSLKGPHLDFEMPREVTASPSPFVFGDNYHHHLINQAHRLRMLPLQVLPPHPKTRPPSRSGAGRPGSRKGQASSMFSRSASRNESFPPLTRAARKQLFLPWWQVPSWPGRLAAQAPDSRAFFLPPPYPAPDPSPFLAPQAGSGPDTGITAQGCPRLGQLLN